MKDRTFKISDFNQLIEVGTTFGMNWFRGQSKVFGNLTPSVFRSQYWGDLIRFFEPDPEGKFYLEFMRKAPSFSEKLPEDEDYLEWLFSCNIMDYLQDCLIGQKIYYLQHTLQSSMIQKKMQRFGVFFHGN